jgi:endonuclease YncB( thermonuclease family)
MKKILLSLLFSATLFAYPATVVKLIDGDTITIKSNDGNVTKLRFADIDSPEKFVISYKTKGDIKTCGHTTVDAAKLSSKYLASIIKIGDTVEVKPTGSTSHDRDVAIIFFKDINLNEEMIQAGYAYVWHTGRDMKDVRYREQLLHYQSSAIQAHTGLWQSYPNEMDCLTAYHK